MRLRGRILHRTYLCRDHFNSSVVRLRALWGRCQPAGWQISIPVWCDWEFEMSLGQLIHDKFQFQCGAIERIHHLSRVDWHARISIPVWCDWEGRRGIGGFRGLLISIPVWCDWETSLESGWVIIQRFQFQCGAIESCRSLKRCHRCFEISIPVWCDWEYANRLGNGPPESFQFQCGAIERLGIAPNRVIFKRFQFQCGAIESAIKSIGKLNELLFQFQCGAIERV